MATDPIENMLKTFCGKYPKTTNYITTEMDCVKNWNIKLTTFMIINVSVLMATIERGDYNDFLRDKTKKISADCIDIFARTYLRNFKYIVDKLSELGIDMNDDIVTFILKVKTSLNPHSFMIKLISQCAD
jgi:hypothetical protein